MSRGCVGVFSLNLTGASTVVLLGLSCDVAGGEGGGGGGGGG